MRQRIQHGAIAWMASNPVSANLIMLLCLVGGLIMASQIKQEVFPEFESEIVTVSVAYPGASPEEVEKGIVLAIEERVTGLDGIKKVTSSSVEGVGTVTIEALEGTDMERLAQDVKGEVDRISSFPEDSETPKVVVASNQRRTLSIAVYGDLEERVLREMAETVRDELLQDPEITRIDLSGARDLEIGIEISQDTLRAHGLTLRQVAEIIGNSALELPGGSVKTAQGKSWSGSRTAANWARNSQTCPSSALRKDPWSAWKTSAASPTDSRTRISTPCTTTSPPSCWTSSASATRRPSPCPTPSSATWSA